jgi:hypothetical protein
MTKLMWATDPTLFRATKRLWVQTQPAISLEGKLSTALFGLRLRMR